MSNLHKWFRGPFTEPESEDEAYDRWRQEMDDNRGGATDDDRFSTSNEAWDAAIDAARREKT